VDETSRLSYDEPAGKAASVRFRKAEHQPRLTLITAVKKGRGNGGATTAAGRLGLNQGDLQTYEGEIRAGCAARFEGTVVLLKRQLIKAGRPSPPDKSQGENGIYPSGARRSFPTVKNPYS